MCQHGCCPAEKRMDHPLPAAAQPPQSMQKPTGWWMGQICSFWVFYWLHVEAQASARIQHSVRERQTNTSIPILHCHVPDFKYARFLWQENHYEYFKMQQRVKINYIGWPFFFSFFFKTHFSQVHLLWEPCIQSKLLHCFCISCGMRDAAPTHTKYCNTTSQSPCLTCTDNKNK